MFCNNDTSHRFSRFQCNREIIKTLSQHRKRLITTRFMFIITDNRYITSREKIKLLHIKFRSNVE